MRDVLCDNTDIVSLLDNVFKSQGVETECRPFDDGFPDEPGTGFGLGNSDNGSW